LPLIPFWERRGWPGIADIDEKNPRIVSLPWREAPSSFIPHPSHDGGIRQGTHRAGAIKDKGEFSQLWIHAQ
jgi:hypothetical protein